MDQPLCDTALTGSKLQTLLSNSSGIDLNGHSIQHVTAQDIGDGQGFMSKVLRIDLTWMDRSADLPKSFIAKIMGNATITKLFEDMEEEETNKMNEHLRSIHNVECSFYELVELRDFLTLPICYATIRNTTVEPGFIILEDLSDRATAMSPKLIGLGVNKIQLDDILDAITTFHAWSVNTSVDWPNKIPPFRDMVFYEQFLNRSIVMYPKAREQYPHSFENLDEDKFKKYLTYEKLLDIFGCDPEKTYNLPRVLVHGDCHFMNMLFEKRENGEYGDRLVAIIDWQGSHQGCGMEDLVKLMAMAMSIEKKKEWKDYMLEKYVELFNRKVTTPTKHITLYDTKRAFNDFFAYQTTMWSVCFQMFDQFTRKIKDITEEERIIVRDRIFNMTIDNFQDARKVFGF